jgi:hypothetical protein
MADSPPSRSENPHPSPAVLRPSAARDRSRRPRRLPGVTRRPAVAGRQLTDRAHGRVDSRAEQLTLARTASSRRATEVRDMAAASSIGAEEVLAHAAQHRCNPYCKENP